MSKWIDFSLDERKAMIQGVVEARQKPCHPHNKRGEFRYGSLPLLFVFTCMT